VRRVVTLTFGFVPAPGAQTPGWVRIRHDGQSRWCRRHRFGGRSGSDSLPHSLRRRLVPQIEGVCVVRPREGEMPATGVRHVDGGWPWPASHLAVDHVGRTREPGVDLQVT
jgi:hypothetical protein